MTPEQLMGTARLAIHSKTKYFRPMLRNFIPVPTEGLVSKVGGPIGVSKDGILVYDPKEIAKMDHITIAGCVIHEFLHLFKKHHERTRTLDPWIFNLAGDLTNNPEVIAMGYKLPDGVIYPKTFGYKEGLSAYEYYALLMNDPNVNKPQHMCLSCTGEGKEDKGEDVRGKTEREMARVMQATAEAVKEYKRSNQLGYLPADLDRIASEYLEPPKVPWQELLSYHVRNAVAFRPGCNTHRYDGPSRFQSGLGWGDGVPILPRLCRAVSSVVVVIDTSGSMSNEQLGMCCREVSGILQSVGADVTVMTCDAQVHGVGRVSNINEVQKLLKGGGGSDFSPAFAELDKVRPRPDVAIFMTDGYIGVPNAKPSGTEVIWLLAGRDCVPPAKWGTSIVVD